MTFDGPAFYENDHVFGVQRNKRGQPVNPNDTLELPDMVELLRLRESTPQRAHFTDEALYQRLQRMPLFLFMAARKSPPDGATIPTRGASPKP